MLHSRDAADCRYKLPPTFSLLLQDLLSSRRNPVIAAPPLVLALDPFALDPSPLLQAVEERVKRGHMKTHGSTGTGLDHAADVIAVARLILYQRENQHLSTALLPFGVRGCCSHI